MNKFILCMMAMGWQHPTDAQNKATGLSRVKLYIDPGHGGTYNTGAHGYSESEKVLRVALALKEYLLNYTDMQEENIMLSRITDADPNTDLSVRTNEANAFGAHFFYSIHSDASTNPGVKSTLFLYGGRRLVAGGSVLEKLPEGGKEFGDILNANLTGVMEVTSRGNQADLNFYCCQTAPSDRLVPYLGVLRGSNMAAHLSEAGFHTNPEQNVCNMNDGYRRMQAYAAYQSLVKFLSKKFGEAPVDPVQVGIATGFIRNFETGAPVNGATIKLVKDAITKTCTTDTYESLFHKYSKNPDELRNGFYWIEGLTPGTVYNATIEAEGFETVQTTLSVPKNIGATTKDGLGKLDINLKKKTVVVYEPKPEEIFPHRVYPNPTDGVFTLELADKNKYQVTITDMSGKTLKRQLINKKITKIDISSFSDGMYLLKIDNGKKQTVTKIVKKR